MFVAKSQYDGILHKDTYLTLQAGTLLEISEQLHEHFQEVGFSLLLEDVLKAVVFDVQYYSSWAVLYAQRNSKQFFEINAELRLEAFEWAIIYPLILAHCELLQAKMMESSRSLSGETFGLSVSEAQTNYQQAMERLQYEASVEPPYTVPLFCEEMKNR